MIRNPKHGWCKFELGDFVGHPSYLTNVPIDMLKAFIFYWDNNNSTSVFFDEEGSDFTLVITPLDIYIIESKEKNTIHVINKTIEELSAELICDIKADIDNWAIEFSYEEEIEENKKEIKELLNELENKMRKSIRN